MPTKTALKGVLHFHSETGTEGGCWAFQDEQHIHYDPVLPYAQPHMTVYDADNRSREGRVIKAWKPDGRLLPDPAVHEAFTDAIGANIEGKLDGEDFKKRMKEIDDMPTYEAEEGEVIRMEVEWQDGATEERLPDSLLVRLWEYQGLHELGSGDKLTIFEKDNPSKIHWQGVVQLTPRTLFKHSVFGMWIQRDMKGWDREEWAKLFFKEYPAELLPK